MHRMLKIEWDAVAGVLAAVIAIVLHLLHVIEAEVLSVITLVLLAAMFLRSLRSDHGQRRIAAGVDRGERLLGQLARRAVPRARHQAGDALPVRRPAGPVAGGGPEGPRLLNRQIVTRVGLSVGFRPLPQTTRSSAGDGSMPSPAASLLRPVW